MQLAKAIPAVWVYTTDSAYNAVRAGGYAPFLTPEQQARIERIRQGRLLFDSKHREYFLAEERTQFDFAPVRVGGRVIQLYLSYNVLGLISLKGADLLFGEEPLLRVDDETQQQKLAELSERCNLHSLLYGCAVDASYEGECFLEACVKYGLVYLRQIPADEIFPIGDLGPDGQFERYDRYNVRNVGTKEQPIWLLLVTTYSAGRIDRRLSQIDDAGQLIKEVTLDQWPMPQGMAPLQPAVTTGLTTNTITWVPNLVVRGQAVSDYDGAIDLQDTLNAKNSQIARVLLKHSDPKIAFPAEAFDASGNIRADLDAFSYTDPNNIPKYITWNAELATALQDRAFVLNQLLVRTETSPALLGLKEGSAPDAYKKVRLESFNSLAKAGRKAVFWKAGIRRALSVAQDLEQTLPGVRYDRGPIGVTLRDGIPQDTLDEAQRLATLKSAGLISDELAVEERLGDPTAVAKEVERIREARASAMPSALMFEPGPAAAATAAGGEAGRDEQTQDNPPEATQ